MRILGFCCGALLTLSAVGAQANSLAYMETSSAEFGSLDLGTGVFTSLGSSGQLLSGMAVIGGTLYGSDFHVAAGTLFTINQADGSLTPVGTSGITYDDFGSTPSGLYAVGFDANLYSVDSTTGAATLIGPTGLSLGGWRSLSTNSSTLYFSNGASFYTLNATTGAATLVGTRGSGEQMGAMLFEDGILWGGENSPSCRVDTVNPSTGAATGGPGVTCIWALAANESSSAVPEPGTLCLFGSGLAALARLRRRLT